MTDPLAPSAIVPIRVRLQPSAGGAEHPVEVGQELRAAAPATRRGRVPAEHGDNGGRRALTGPLDGAASGVGVAARLELGDARGIGTRTEEVSYLVSLRDGVQVGGGSGITRGLCSETGGFGGGLLRRAVCVHRAHPLQPRPARAVHELPGRLDRRARPGIVRMGVLKDGENVMSGLRDEPCDCPQLVAGQLEPAPDARHESIVALPTDADTRTSEVRDDP